MHCAACIHLTKSTFHDVFKKKHIYLRRETVDVFVHLNRQIFTSIFFLFFFLVKYEKRQKKKDVRVRVFANNARNSFPGCFGFFEDVVVGFFFFVFYNYIFSRYPFFISHLSVRAFTTGDNDPSSSFSLATRPWSTFRRPRERLLYFWPSTRDRRTR